MDRQARTRELIRQMGALPEEERLEFLKHECGGEPELLAELLDLLELEEPGTSTSQVEMILTRALDPQPPPTPEGLSESFPQLEIIELIGAGGSGAVYRARQTTLDRPVALKILDRDLARSSGFVARFEREARALAALNHPHIVTIHDAGHAGPHLFLLMELVDGQNLRQYAAGERPSSRTILRIMSQICSALQFAHDAGLVHRDIKPENILLDMRGDIRIADFGLVKSVARDPGSAVLTRHSQVMGTPQYMAPEQYETPTDVDHRVDLYALGVVLYELLTGELPIGRFDVPSELCAADERFDRIVLRALEKDRERRYQNADEIKTDVLAMDEVVTRFATSTEEPSTKTTAEFKPPGSTGLADSIPSPPRRAPAPSKQARPNTEKQAAPGRFLGEAYPAPPPAPVDVRCDFGGCSVVLVRSGADHGAQMDVIREVLPASPPHLEEWLDTTPRVLAVNVDPYRAELLKARLEDCGAEVWLN